MNKKQTIVIVVLAVLLTIASGVCVYLLWDKYSTQNKIIDSRGNQMIWSRKNISDSSNSALNAELASSLNTNRDCM